MKVEPRRVPLLRRPAPGRTTVGIAWRVTSPGAATYLVQTSEPILPEPRLAIGLSLKLQLMLMLGGRLPHERIAVKWFAVIREPRRRRIAGGRPRHRR